MIAGMTTLKWVDTLIMRIVDIVLSYPFMILAMAIVYNLGASTKKFIFSTDLSWMGWNSENGESANIVSEKIVHI